MRFISVLLLAAAIGGCSTSPSPMTPATAEEAEVLARELDVRLHNKDVAGDLFSYDAQVDIAAKTFKVGGPGDWFHRSVAANSAKKALRATPVTTALLPYLQEGHLVELLRVRTTAAGQTSALFHYFSPTEGLGYLELVVAKIDGVPRFVDYIPLTTCEPHVASVMAAGMAAGRDRGLLENNVVSTVMENRSTTGFVDGVKAGRYAEAMLAYDEMPAEMQSQRAMLALRLVAAKKLGEPRLGAAIAALRAQTTDPRCNELLAIDAFFEAGNYTAVLNSIDLIDTAVGGDPLLDVLRMGVARTTGDVERTKALAAKFMPRFPSIVVEL